MPLADFIYLILAVFAAAMVQGITGFGFGLVAIVLIGLFTDVRTASFLLAVPGLSLNLIMIWRLRSHIKLKPLLPIFVSVIIAAPLGVLFLKKADVGLLNMILGVILVVSAVYNLIPHFSRRPWHPIFLGVPAGLLSGLLSGAFGTGGPPLVAYVSTQGYDNLRYVASIQILIVSATIIRVEELLRQKMLTLEVLPNCAIAALFAVAGGLLGMRILAKLSSKTLRRMVAVILLALGIWKVFF